MHTVVICVRLWAESWFLKIFLSAHYWHSRDWFRLLNTLWPPAFTWWTQPYHRATNAGIDHSRPRTFLVTIGRGEVSTWVDKERLLSMRGGVRRSGMAAACRRFDEDSWCSGTCFSGSDRFPPPFKLFLPSNFLRRVQLSQTCAPVTKVFSCAPGLLA